MTSESSVPFRILSLDGGGIKGTYTAAVLAGIEEITRKRIVDHFDLIVGTSTGGIVALALGMGLPAGDILRFYEEKGPSIFPLVGVQGRLWAMLRHMFRSKHSIEPLRSALANVLGDHVVGDSLTRLVLVSYDGSSGDVYMIKTAHHPRFKNDYSMRAIDAALATSAAPTFLPAFVGRDGTKLVDGGVWANCPAAVAVTEAMTVLGQRSGEFDLLSVGTTESPLHVSRRKLAGGILQWALFGPDLLLQAQAKGALAQAKLLTGAADRMLRLNEVVEPKRFSLDNPSSIQDLKALGMKAARHYGRIVAERFLAAPVSEFVPYHGPRSEAAVSNAAMDHRQAPTRQIDRGAPS